MAGIQATGVGSNLDVQGLVDKMMEVEKLPLAALDKKEAAAQVKISSYGTFRGSLSTFQGTLKALADVSTYSVSKGSVDDATVASVTTNNDAPAGSFSLEVTNLAQAQKLASGSFKSLNDAVGTGTLTFQFGTYDNTNNANTFTVNGNKPTKSVQIDAAHNTLAGVRDAINKANIGVSANIVNDGKGFRLVMSSKDTGAANGLKVMVSGDGSGDTDMTGLSQLSYDPTLTAFDANTMGTGGKNLSQIMEAKDAQMIVDGLAVSSASNTVTDVVAGTTINLLKANPGSPTKVNITSDSSKVGTSIDAFVKAYNDLNKTISDLTKYNADSASASPLQGDPAIRNVAAQIRDSLTSMVKGSVGSFHALPQVGIAFDRTGNLVFDKGKFDTAMKNDPNAVQGLFSTIGVTDDSLIKFVGGNENTRAGDYSLNVSQVATQATVVASATISTLSIDSTNDSLSVTVNSVSATIKLTQKTYATQADLMSEVQSKINASGALQTAKAAVSLKADDNNILTLNSTAWGSTSKLAVTGNGAANLFGANPTISDGLDVAGTIGGMAASGAGQRLTGTAGASGLKLDVLGGATGERGSVRYGVGIAGQLDAMITKLLDSKGLLAAKTDGLNKQVKAIEHDRESLNARLATTEQRYKTQFNSLDQQLSSMNSMSSYLAQQLAAIKLG